MEISEEKLYEIIKNVKETCISKSVEVNDGGVI